MENKSAKDENGSYNGGAVNRVTIGCYRAKNGKVLGERTRGLEYSLVGAFGKSSFESEMEEEKVKRSFYGVWPTLAYRLDDGESPNLKLGVGAIPFIQIAHRRAGNNHHANYFGGEIIFGLEFNYEDWPMDMGVVFTYGRLKKATQSDNKVEDIYRLPEDFGFFSMGISATGDVF